MTDTIKSNKNRKNKTPMEEEILELHDYEKKIQVLNELLKISKTTKEITVLTLSKMINFEVTKLNIFLEELILADKINARIINDVISFL